MIRLVKLLKWDLQSKDYRFNYILFLLRNLPGGFGMAVRSRFLSKHIGASGQNLTIHEGVRIRNIHRLICGDHVTIGVDNFLQAAGWIKIGNDVLLGPGVKIWSSNHVFDDPYTPVSQQGYEEKQVLIGNNVWIGANCFIMPGAQIGDGCIVSAGSVVGAKTIPPYTVLAGNPARKISNRIKE